MNSSTNFVKRQFLLKRQLRGIPIHPQDSKNAVLLYSLNVYLSSWVFQMGRQNMSNMSFRAEQLDHIWNELLYSQALIKQKCSECYWLYLSYWCVWSWQEGTECLSRDNRGLSSHQLTWISFWSLLSILPVFWKWISYSENRTILPSLWIICWVPPFLLREPHWDDDLIHTYLEVSLIKLSGLDLLNQFLELDCKPDLASFGQYIFRGSLRLFCESIFPYMAVSRVAYGLILWLIFSGMEYWLS